MTQELSLDPLIREILRDPGPEIMRRLPKTCGMIGRFAVVGVLGRGGMGVVLEAIDTELDRAVAVKVMRPWVARQPDQVARFLAEAKSLAAVTHPNVVTIFDVGREGPSPFLAMERLRGQTLAEAIDRAYSLGSNVSADGGEPDDTMVGNAIDIRRVCGWAQQTAEGLAAVHQQGLLHRDLKPSNLWCEESREQIRLLDFGLASRASVDSVLRQQSAVSGAATEAIAEDTGSSLQRNNASSRGGTLHYLSPEQVAGDPPSTRSDLYALGVTLFECFTGRLPHSSARDADPKRPGSATSMMVAIGSRDAPPIETLRPELGGKTAELINQLLQRRPEMRPASASGVAETLREINHQFSAPRAIPPLIVAGRRPPEPSTSTAKRWAPVLAVVTAVFVVISMAEARIQTQPPQPLGNLWEPVLATPSHLAMGGERIERTCTVTPRWVAAMHHESRQPSVDGGGVLVRYQRLGKDRRSNMLMSFERIDQAVPQPSIVDAVLLMTLQGGITSSEPQRMEVFGFSQQDLPDGTDDVRRWNVSRFEEMVRQDVAKSLGRLDVLNPGYRNNGTADAIRFSSANLVRFLSEHRNQRVYFWIQRRSPSHAQTVFWATADDPASYPKLKLRWTAMDNPTATADRLDNAMDRDAMTGVRDRTTQKRL